MIAKWYYIPFFHNRSKSDERIRKSDILKFRRYRGIEGTRGVQIQIQKIAIPQSNSSMRNFKIYKVLARRAIIINADCFFEANAYIDREFQHVLPVSNML
jgi:hypothetical protein